MSHFQAFGRCFKHSEDARWHAMTTLGDVHSVLIDEAVRPCMSPDTCTLPEKQPLTPTALARLLCEGMGRAS